MHLAEIEDETIEIRKSTADKVLQQESEGGANREVADEANHETREHCERNNGDTESDKLTDIIERQDEKSTRKTDQNLEKLKKQIAKFEKVSELQAMKPKWTHAVQVRNGVLYDKIGDISVGFRAINNNSLELTGSGNNKIDGARWCKGFTSGKHIIEFIYPIHLRGAFSRVGLGTKDTELGGNNPRTILGGAGTWAIDLDTRRALCNGRNCGTFPPYQVLPDWFFMYVDLDTGIVQFGSDGEFYGTAFTDVFPNGEPLYPIVTASKKGAIIGMVYRGEGKEINGPLRKKRRVTSKWLEKLDRN